MYVKDLKKKFLVIKNGGISRWTLTQLLHYTQPSHYTQARSQTFEKGGGGELSRIHELNIP